MNKIFLKNTKNGMPFFEERKYSTYLEVHRDHIGYIMGKNSKTLKKIMNITHCRIVLQKANKYIKNKWFLIQSKSLDKLISAYDRLIYVCLNSNKVIPRDFNYKIYNNYYPYSSYVNKNSPTYIPQSPTYMPQSPISE